MDNREIATASLPPQALRCQLPQRWSQEYGVIPESYQYLQGRIVIAEEEQSPADVAA